MSPHVTNVTECHRMSPHVMECHGLSLKPSKMHTFPQNYQNQFWHMLQYVKNDAYFESEVCLAWNLQKLWHFDDLLLYDLCYGICLLLFEGFCIFNWLQTFHWHLLMGLRVVPRIRGPNRSQLVRDRVLCFGFDAERKAFAFDTRQVHLDKLIVGVGVGVWLVLWPRRTTKSILWSLTLILTFKILFKEIPPNNQNLQTIPVE